MNKYILLAMNELEAGNYDAYQVYMKLNKNTRVTKAWQREILTEKDRDSSDDDFRESSESCSQNRWKPEGNYYSIKPWTEEEHAYLRESYQSISDKKMAAVLDRSVEGVKSRRIKLGLKRKTGKP